jgi:hypothetical protein
MRLHRWEDIRRRHFTPEELAKLDREIEEEIVEMNLHTVRKYLHKTQTEVAKAAKMAQGDVSVVERRKDHLLSTLRRYVEALGGELEVSAIFGRKRIRLRGV